MVTFYPSQHEAREDAAARGLREKVLVYAVRGAHLLVFTHADVPEAGVQVPAGGVEPGETPQQAAVRELYEESGVGPGAPRHLVSYRWEAQTPERATRQVCHAFALTAPGGLPDTWTHAADGHVFHFRWAPAHAPALDWEMDTALPWLTTDPTPDTTTTPSQETHA